MFSSDFVQFLETKTLSNLTIALRRIDTEFGMTIHIVKNV